MMMDEQDRESEAGLTSNEQTSPGGDGVRPLSPDESTASVPGPISFSQLSSPSASPSASTASDDFVGSPASVSPLRWTRRPVDAVIERRRRAKAHVEREEFSEALQLLDECVSLSQPRASANLYRLRCLCLSRLGRHREALDDAILIHQLKPYSSTSGFHLGSALYAVGDYSNAARAFQEALAINPQDRALREGLRNALTMITNLRNQNPRGTGLGLGEVEGHSSLDLRSQAAGQAA